MGSVCFSIVGCAGSSAFAGGGVGLGGAAEVGSVLGVFPCFVSAFGSAFFSSSSALRGYRVKCSGP